MHYQENRIVEAANRHFNDLVSIQRDIHAHPELGYEESRTAAIVARELRVLGFEVRTGVVSTGVVATLKGDTPGETVGLRVDMDAFPIQEAEGLPWISQNPGCAHVCGHDAHTTIGIGVARVLAEMREELAGRVKFIFQPAEERPRVFEEGERPYLEGVKAKPAAAYMIEEGVLADPPVKAIFGLHLWPELEAGKIGVENGPSMAGAANFRASVLGKSAHGAMPETGVDSIVAVAQVLNMLQTIVSRQVPAGEPLVVTVGTIRGGDRRNVIADRVDITGTVRALSAALLQKTVPTRMEAILKGLTDALGASYELDYWPLIPPVMNDALLADIAREAITASLGEGAVIAEMTRGMTSEDFACFSEAVPGLYMKIGCTTPGTDPIPLHNRAFSFDVEAIRAGVVAVAAAIYARLMAAKE